MPSPPHSSATEVPGAFSLPSPSEDPLLCSTSPRLPRKRSREDPWQLPILPGLSSLLNSGQVGTSVLISHQCWRGGMMAAPANANIGPLCLLRAGGTDRSPQDFCHSSSPTWGWSLPCNEGEALTVPARGHFVRLQICMPQSFSRGWCLFLPLLALSLHESQNHFSWKRPPR